MTTALETPDKDATKQAEPDDAFPSLARWTHCDGNYSSQALVRLVRGTQDMCFSAHYFEKVEDGFIKAGWKIHEDIREAVLNPPKTSYDTSEH